MYAIAQEKMIARQGKYNNNNNNNNNKNFI